MPEKRRQAEELRAQEPSPPLAVTQPIVCAQVIDIYNSPKIIQQVKEIIPRQNLMVKTYLWGIHSLIAIFFHRKLTNSKHIESCPPNDGKKGGKTKGFPAFFHSKFNLFFST
jgi:hypothetical protein